MQCKVHIQSSQTRSLESVFASFSSKIDDDTYIELYAVKRYWKVHKEGNPDYDFDAQAPTTEEEVNDEQRLLPDAIGVHLSGEACTTETIIAL